MTQRIRFEEITLQTAGGRHHYQFSDSITTIVGPVGAGKTSLLELLKYGIGGSGVLSQAATTAVQRVLVTTRLGDSTFIFSRFLGSLTVDIHSADGALVETVSTRSSRHHRLASDFLLEGIGLPSIPVTRARPTPGGRTERLSFFDIYRFCYLPQSEIDRSVVRHLDSVLERRRKTAFELLFGLTDSESALADARVAEVSEELSDARHDEEAVRRFLEHAGGTSEVELLHELDRIESAITSGREQLVAMRSDMRRVTSDEAERQRRVAEFASRLRALNEQTMQLQAQLREHAASVAQYDLHLERLTRTGRARELLTGVEFTRCPRCLQSISERPVESGHCPVCTQLDSPRPTVTEPVAAGRAEQLGFGEFAVNDERRRIAALREETLGLAEDDRRGLETAFADQRALEVAMREMLTELDRRTEQYVSPRFEAISELSARVASAEARKGAVSSALAYWEHHRELAMRTAELERAVDAAKTSAADARALLEKRREVVKDVSEAFDEIIRRVEPPWYESARVDLKNYLPVLNESPFESLSGGEKTIVNVVYHLALLTVALARKDTLFPAMLLIDTPRKNLGAGQDQALAVAMYRQIRILSDAYGDAFQLIIADNDPPPVPLGKTTLLQLDYDRPLIPDLEHPGEDVETLADTSE